MLKILCLLLIFAGSGTMLASIVIYRNTLKAYMPHKGLMLDRYTATLLLMVFFLLGYTATFFYLLSLAAIEPSMVLIVLIFFFGAIFCYAVVYVQSELLARLEQNADELRRAFGEAKTANANLEELNHELMHTMDALKNAQGQLVFSEKMSALGKLMAGISHEINTPISAVRASAGTLQTALSERLPQMLTDIRGLSEEDYQDYIRYMETAAHNTRRYTSTAEVRALKRKARQTLEEAEGYSSTVLELLARDYLLDDETIASVVPKLTSETFEMVLRLISQTLQMTGAADNVAGAAEKVIRMVSSLKSFSHFSAGGEKAALNVITGIETVLTLFLNQLKYDVEVVTEFEAVPEIMGYEDELGQVWSNLIQNAVYAMHEGHATPPEEREPNRLTITVKNTDDHRVAVTIADNGGGISPEKAGKIFEPFFTTKPTGVGTGLGLSISKQIVDKHNGVISVESELGRGTTFTILLPA